MQRLFSREIEHRAYEEQPQDFESIRERDPCMQMEEDNLVENLQCKAEAW
jgi:hypothetical protein